MNLWQAFKMAWKSIWGKKGRSALTILGIFIGIAAVMTIVSAMDGMRRYTMAQYAAMGSGKINAQVYSWMYDDEGNSLMRDYFPDVSRYVQAADFLEGVTPNINFGGTIIYGTKSTANMERGWDDRGNPVGEWPPNLYGGSEQYALCNNLTLEKGRDLAYLDTEGYGDVCVMGADAARTFFGNANPVGKVIQAAGRKITVVGVYASRTTEETRQGYSGMMMDNFIVFPYTTVNRYLNAGGGGDSNRFVIKAKDDADLNEAITRLQTFLSGLAGDFGDGWAYSENQWAEMESQYLAVIGGILGGIAAISLLVGGIGIMNIMLVTVTERTREIGIRRAIGAQRSSIVAQFLIEAAMLCGIGGIVGIGFGTIGSLVLGRLLLQMTIYPSFPVTMGAFSLSVAIGLLFGSYPAAKASGLQPVEALRAE